ncbi:DNA polymerase [Sphingomonas sp. Leaf357]|uniref:error-prone DNA polymerase n=1 Tax=Sphingomonas sp. Leaf357 TaxID=1736350 RepID=UPI0006FCA647|nr:error-prone DNA polymerase [Sphingomonas sp. Leaf357]KQS03416.1 DNA polymerase [Sphingomonas sp. Leaf357]
MTAFAELVAATNYSFLRGASHASDMIGVANALGMTGIGIADRNTVAGVVRAWSALKTAPDKARVALLADKKARGEPETLSDDEWASCEIDLRLIVGARLVFVDGTPDIIAYPATRFGWGRLTRLLTVGNLRAVKGDCILRFADLIDYAQDLLLIALPYSTAQDEATHRDPVDYDYGHPPKPMLRLVEVPPADLEGTLVRLRRVAPDRVWLGAAMPHRGRDARDLVRLNGIAHAARVPLIATNDALYAMPEQRPLHDVLTCIRLGTTIAAAGKRLEANAERHLKHPAEMARLFRDHPQAIAQTQVLLSQIEFDLKHLRYEYPHEPVPEGWEAQAWLEHLVWNAAIERYADYMPPKVIATLAEEFVLISARNYAYYFLTVYDLVRFARAQDPPILCQGRGSAANSAVCFLLGVTSIDPMQHDLLFSRFVSDERDEPPDIDVDFEHERREEVMQYIYRRYGRHRAGIAATVAHYRSRSTVRQVAKALGLSEDIPERMASTVWGSHSGDMEDRRIVEAGFDLANPQIARLRFIMDQILEAPFPRHLSQHVGGFVLTENRLDETVPLHHGAMADRTFIEWDKDDIDALGLMKVDVLALGMLTCIRKSYDLLERHGFGKHTLNVDLDSNDPAVYEMLQKGDSIGVFQVESRAQMNMLPRLRPRNLYDLTVQVAIVRPGPIQGDMVHPYLRRRTGVEKVEYPAPDPKFGPEDELKTLLGNTYGVPLFQEQAMKLAIVAAAFTPSEANQLRRAMATFRNVGGMHNFREKLVGGMMTRGYQQDFAERCYKQIEGFGSYGFPESHALSFARLVYVSSWIKCHHPAVFACALLNSQPMGFYAPAQIVRDAIEHDVVVRAIDVNASCWDSILEIEPQQFEENARASVRAEPVEASSSFATVENGNGPSTGSGRTGIGQGSDHQPALRLGLRQITGFKGDWADTLVRAREGAGPFTSIEGLARRADLPERALRLLADADAFGSIGLDRRDALWEARRTPSAALPLFAAAEAAELGKEVEMALPAMSDAEHVVADYQMTRLSLKAHPMSFLRPILDAEGVLSCAATSASKNGAQVRTAGIVLVRQRPGKGNAIFVTIEDESGVTNIVMWARMFERFRRQVMASRLMEVEGIVQKAGPIEGNVVHLMASRIVDRTDLLDHLSDLDKAKIPLLRADVFENAQPSRSPGARQATPSGHNTPRHGHPRDVRIIPKSRDFH